MFVAITCSVNFMGRIVCVLWNIANCLSGKLFCNIRNLSEGLYKVRKCFGNKKMTWDTMRKLFVNSNIACFCYNCIILLVSAKLRVRNHLPKDFFRVL